MPAFTTSEGACAPAYILRSSRLFLLRLDLGRVVARRGVEIADGTAIGGLEDADIAVGGAAGDELAVRADGDGVDHVGEASHCLERGAGHRIPGADGQVGAARG